MSALTGGRRRAATSITGLRASAAAARGPLRRAVRRSVDVLLPILLGLFLASLVDYSPDPVAPAIRVFGMIVGLGQGVALYWRRSHPRTVTAIAVLGGAIVQLIAPAALFPYAGLVAIWTLAGSQPPRISLPGLAGLLGVTALSWPPAAPDFLSVQPADPPPGEDTGFALAVVVTVWALAEATRSRRAAIAQASRQAAEREQARLTRELHDVIAHSVSVIVVQAAAGDDVFEHNPAAAREALRSIESAGRQALAELRRLLAAIGPPEPAEGRHPQPELTRLEDLAEPLRAVGLIVEINHLEDVSEQVPTGVQLSAYRIGQEALTNVVRHARAHRIEVRVRTDDQHLELTVTDDGTPGAFVPGRGIAGMRERAALLGGTLEAGPEPDGGFRVRARLPVSPTR